MVFLPTEQDKLLHLHRHIFCLPSVPISPAPSKTIRPQREESWQSGGEGEKKESLDIMTFPRCLTAVDPLSASRAPCSTRVCSIRNTSCSILDSAQVTAASTCPSYKCQAPHWEPSIQNLFLSLDQLFKLLLQSVELSSTSAEFSTELHKKRRGGACKTSGKPTCCD